VASALDPQDLGQIAATCYNAEQLPLSYCTVPLHVSIRRLRLSMCDKSDSAPFYRYSLG